MVLLFLLWHQTQQGHVLSMKGDGALGSDGAWNNTGAVAEDRCTGAGTRQLTERTCASFLRFCGSRQLEGSSWQVGRVLLFTAKGTAYLPPNTHFESAAGSDVPYTPLTSP